MIKKNIFYWSPHINDQIATIKAVKNSIFSMKKFGKNDYEIYLFNVFGEWDQHKHEFKLLGVKLINLFNFKVKLPINGFIKSRIFYIFISIISIFKLPYIFLKLKPDYVIAHLIVFPIIFLSNFFFKRIKFILRISGMPKLNFFRLIYWKILSKKLYYITCPSFSTKEKLIKKRYLMKKKLFTLRIQYLT